MEHQARIINGFVSVIVALAVIAGGMALLPAQKAEAAVIGGEYGSVAHVAVLGGLTSANAASVATPSEWGMLTLVYDSLARTDPATLDSIPWVAKGWTVNTTGATPVVHVELNAVNWHDGTAMTAADVAASYTAMKANPMYASMLTGVTIAADGAKVKFTFTAAKGNFFSEILQVPLVKGTSVGSGPFKLASDYDANPIELVANDDYFAGRPYLNGVNFHSFDSKAFADADGNATELGQMWAAGELDLIAWSIAAYEPAIQMDINGTTVMVGDFGGMKLSPGLSYFYMGINLDNAPLDDKVFRQVLSMCCDKKQVALTDFSNYATAADSAVLSANSFWYNASLDYMGLVDKDGTGKVVADELAPMMAMLGEAGYNDRDGDGWRDLPDGTPFTLELLAPANLGPDADLLGDAVAGRIGAVFTALGIKVDKVDASWDGMWTDVEDGNFDLYLNYQTVSIDPAYLDSLFGTGGALNYGGFTNALVDAKLDAAATAMVPEERQAFVRDVQGILNEETPVIPLTYPKQIELYDTADLPQGWVSTAGGLHNFWTYTGLRQVVAGDLSVTLLSSEGAAIDSGETTTIDATVIYAESGLPAVGAYVTFTLDGVGTLSSTVQVAVDAEGKASVTYTAPTVTAATDIFVTVEAVKDAYNAATTEIGVTVHPLEYKLEISSVTIANPTLLSGESTTIVVTVLDQDGQPANGATVNSALTLTNLGATITPATATAGTAGTATFTFTAVVTLNVNFGLVFTASMAGYAGDVNDGKQIRVNPRILSVTIIAADTITLSEANAEKEMTVTVQVYEGADPVEGATVTLTLEPSGTATEFDTLTGTTDADGEATFTLTGKAAKDTPYVVTATAEKDGFVSGEDGYQILVHIPAEQDSFIPAPGIVLGVVAMLGVALALYYRRK